MATVHALSGFYDKLSRVLQSEVGVSPAFSPIANPASPVPTFTKYTGIWDTGASASVITQKVVDELSLKPTGMTMVYHAQGQKMAEVYLANIALPNGVNFHNLRVTKGELAGGDVLIGMDVIGQGDFAVSNFQGKTSFTFRVPSIQAIDFTNKASPQTKLPHPPAPKVTGRNDSCPCGSGKKYKHCCLNK